MLPSLSSLPFYIRSCRGAIGRRYIIKHYGRRRVMTRFPDMSRIIATHKQRKCRNVFKEAVAFALPIIRNADKKKEWQNKLKKKAGDLYNALIKTYMLTAKAAVKEKQELKIIKGLLKPSPTRMKTAKLYYAYPIHNLKEAFIANTG